MTHDTINDITEANSSAPKTPPLCLMHYFAERTESPPDRIIRPPEPRARIAERRGNLIILEFAAPLEEKPRSSGRTRKSLIARFCDALFLLLFLGTLLGCIAAFRF